ncbi:protein JASON-like isoform X3 [Miscanthus floridulus]|uniref:protein JASON-like isoform X3 n=1 Tax=Miscanthus floridulus TaxID=154761 RepID=UPI0034594446
MGCFISCFRGGSDPSGDLRDPLVRESRLGDAFLNDEKKFDEATGKLDAEAANGHGIDEELRREANYLKSCGTISQTPPEILDSIPINSEDAKECGDTPTSVQLMKDAVLLEENSSELLNSDEHDISRHEQDIDEGTLRVGSETQSSLEDKPLYHNVRDQSSDSNDSPYPTPLVLRGDIQTPGTYYTAYKETSKPGKRTRASRQFIYPVLRPIENKMQWMELKAESPVLSSNPPKRRNLSADSTEMAQQTFASSTVTETESSEYVSFPIYDNYAAQNEVMSPDEPKGQNVNQLLDEDDESNSSPDDGNVGKETWYEASVSDVPIFPTFGLNWETDNPTPVLPKAWDGNGIPNTTTKYKEDQKVSWHATPFEERLLKVLSDEKPRHERKISGKLIHLEENAE